MNRHLCVILMMLPGMLYRSAAQAQGVLQQMRHDVQHGTESEEDEHEDESEDRRRPSEFDDYDDHSPWGEFFGTALFMGITPPFWGPPVWIADDYASTTYLSYYPYQHDTSGFVLLDPLPRSEHLYNWSLRARGEYADDFDSMTRYGGRILWESRNRFGVDTSLDYRREALSDGRNDDLWTGDANIVFRFAQSEFLMMRTGLGANYLTADHGTDLGFNFTYAGEWFPIRPWVVSAELDWGWLGKAGLFHGRTTIGVNIHHVEVYTGYSYFDVGSAQVRGVISGIQVWY